MNNTESKGEVFLAPYAKARIQHVRDKTPERPCDDVQQAVNGGQVSGVKLAESRMRGEDIGSEVGVDSQFETERSHAVLIELSK